MAADRLAQARVGWRAAEERLYPLAMVDPEGYQAMMGPVSVLLEVLRRDTNRCAELLELADRPESLLAALPDPRSAAVPDATLLGAAFAIRDRELIASAATQERQRRIDAARAGGHDWVHLDGPVELTELFAGHRIELHLPTGTGLIATVDPWSGGDPFLLEAVPAEPGGERRTQGFGNQAAWRAEYHAWRAAIAALTTEADTVSDSK